MALVAFFAWLGVTVNDTFDDIASLGRGVRDAGSSVQNSFEDAGGLVAEPCRAAVAAAHTLATPSRSSAEPLLISTSTRTR